MTSARLALRVSTDPAYGRGHLARCAALRAQIDGPVHWFVDPGPRLAAVPSGPRDSVVVERGGHAIGALYDAACQGAVTGAVIDSYTIAAQDIAMMDGLVPTVALVDAPPYPSARLVVDAQPTARPAPGVLAGVQYAMMDQELLSWRGLGGTRPAGDGGRLRLLVSFGAVDSVNRTGLVLSALSERPMQMDRISLTVVLGAGAPHLGLVRAAAAAIPGARVIIDASNMGELYAKSDLAIGAPGISHCERMMCGVPTILIAQNLRQEALASAWVEKGAALCAAPDEISVGRLLGSLLDDDESLVAMRNTGIALIDGLGAGRVASHLAALMSR